MTTRFKIVSTLVLMVLLGGLGAADYFFTGNELAANLPVAQNPAVDTQNSSQPTNPTQGVAKRRAADVEQTLAGLGFETQQSDDKSMLEQVVGGDALSTRAILKNGDRIGAVIWIDSPESKNYFFSLKEALLASFSGDVKDLQDQTKIEEGKPIRYELTFLDPGLSAERLTFVRVGERLLEFHAAEGKETELQGAIDGVSSL